MRKAQFPAFVGGYMTEAQKAKLVALAAANRWTMGEAVRALIDAAELQPMALTVVVSVPEACQDGDAGEP